MVWREESPAGQECPAYSPSSSAILAIRYEETSPGTQERAVAYVVTEPCFGCKYTDCVVVCPCDCFREGEQMLFIDPDECIDCDACKPECPVDAIFHEDDVPEAWREFVALNREMAATCPPIVDRKEPLARRGPEP
jgi:ferredoxin